MEFETKPNIGKFIDWIYVNKKRKTVSIDAINRIYRLAWLHDCYIETHKILKDRIKFKVQSTNGYIPDNIQSKFQTIIDGDALGHSSENKSFEVKKCS